MSKKMNKVTAEDLVAMSEKQEQDQAVESVDIFDMVDQPIELAVENVEVAEVVEEAVEGTVEEKPAKGKKAKKERKPRTPKKKTVEAVEGEEVAVEEKPVKVKKERKAKVKKPAREYGFAEPTEGIKNDRIEEVAIAINGAASERWRLFMKKAGDLYTLGVDERKTTNQVEYIDEVSGKKVMKRSSCEYYAIDIVDGQAVFTDKDSKEIPHYVKLKAMEYIAKHKNLLTAE